jgi:two-component system phosphate regulon response regulator PhoB
MDSFRTFSPRLLLIENDQNIAEPLLRCFEKEGYLVKWSADSSETFSMIEQFVPNIIIVSWGTVGLSGLDLCLKIRSDVSFNETKVIVISEVYNEIDAIRVLTVGADDYLGRPISDIELVTRAWAQLRFLRAKSFFSGGKKTIRRAAPVDFVLNEQEIKNTLKHNGIEMLVEARDVRRHGAPIKLRDAEFRLLAILLREPKKIFTRQELINHLWEQPDKIDYRTIDVMMGRLRKSLTLPNRTDPIRAVRGLGYGLSLDDPLTVKRKSRRPSQSSGDRPADLQASI